MDDKDLSFQMQPLRMSQAEFWATPSAQPPIDLEQAPPFNTCYLDYSEYGTFTLNRISMTDAVQGHLLDCGFISTVAAIANTCPAYINKIMTNKKDGTYDVKFFSSATCSTPMSPVTISVDSHLPIKKPAGVTDCETWVNSVESGPLSGFVFPPALTPIYAHSLDVSPKQELWSGLLEKAYAKYTYGTICGPRNNGDYDSTESRNAITSFRVLFGQSPTVLDPSEFSAEERWAQLHVALGARKVVVAYWKSRDHWVPLTGFTTNGSGSGQEVLVAWNQQFDSHTYKYFTFTDFMNDIGAAYYGFPQQCSIANGICTCD